MEIDNFNRDITILTNCLIYNRCCIKSSNDILIFGYMFGYFANLLKENFSIEMINQIKREFNELTDVSAFKNLYEKIKFLESELKKVNAINNQSKQNNIFPSPSNSYQKNNNDKKLVEINPKNIQNFPNKSSDNSINRIDTNNIYNVNHPNSRLISQGIDKNTNSINFYNNFGNNNIKNKVVDNQLPSNNKDLLSKHDRNPPKKDVPQFNNYDNKKNYPIIHINSFESPFNFYDQKRILESEYPGKSDHNINNEFGLLNNSNYLKENLKNNQGKSNRIPIKSIEEEFGFYYEKEEVSNDIECQICTEKFNFLDQDNAFLDCSCIIHGICFTSYIENEITQNNLPINCPNQACRREVNPAIILKLIKTNEPLFKKYEKFGLSYYQKTKEDIFSCPTPDCDYVFFNDQEQNRFDCPKCKNSYCLKCNVNYHKDQTCQEYLRSNSEKEKDKEFFDLAKNNKFKQCPKCKMFVEKNQGCDHMTCRCGHEFCYICGKSYLNRRPSCLCKGDNCLIF